MKVLQLCLRVPFPPRDGGAIAMYNLAESLVESGIEVKQVCFNTLKNFVSTASLPIEYSSRYKPVTVDVDTKVRPLSALISLLKGGSYNIERFDVDAMHQLLAKILVEEDYDAVIIESLFMAPYIPTIRKYSSARILYRSHNIENVIWKRLAEQCNPVLKRWYLNLLSDRLKDYEINTLKNFDAIAAMTQADCSWYVEQGFQKQAVVIPVGVNVKSYGVMKDPSFHNLFHLGSMDWQPNIEGVNWFISEVYPLLKTRLGATQIHLAGKNMPDVFFDVQDENLKVEGFVQDSDSFMKDKAIMLVPLLSGGGMRVKIIEGLAAGKVIISTTIGAEGIDVKNGHDILIADTASDFCEAILKCINDSAFSIKIASNARQTAEQKYDRKVLATEFIKLIKNG